MRCASSPPTAASSPLLASPWCSASTWYALHPRGSASDSSPALTSALQPQFSPSLSPSDILLSARQSSLPARRHRASVEARRCTTHRAARSWSRWGPLCLARNHQTAVLSGASSLALASTRSTSSPPSVASSPASASPQCSASTCMALQPH
eukprot:1567495-Rhodomonas_salina.3